MFFFLWLLLIVSRLGFLANYPHFFDAPEYLSLAGQNHFWQTIMIGHNPIHPVYFWLLGFVSQPWQLSLISAIFGLVGIYVFYLLIKLLFSQKTARLALPFLIFFPHLWLIHTNILHEAVEQGFFVASLYFSGLYFKQQRVCFLLFSALLLYLSLMTFLGIIIWFPIFGALIVFTQEKNKKKLLLHVVLMVVLVIVLALFTYSRLLPKTEFQTLVQAYVAGNFLKNWSWLNILRMMRNSGLILIFGYSLSGLLVLIYSGWRLIKKPNWKLLILSVAFLIPFFLTAKFWYGGLYGRYSSFVAYYLALLFALLPKRRIYYLLLVTTIISFIFTAKAYHQGPIPKIQAELILQLPKLSQSVLIISDYQRPQLEFERVLPKKTLIIQDNDFQNQLTIKQINQALKQKRTVYFTNQAVTFPYYQYDGQQLQLISRGQVQKAKLALFLTSHQIKLVNNNPKLPYLNLYELK